MKITVVPKFGSEKKILSPKGLGSEKVWVRNVLFFGSERSLGRNVRLSYRIGRPPSTVVRRPSYVFRRSSSKLIKHLLLRNRLAKQSQISYGASMGWGTKVCSNDPGHMTKMAAMPIYGKKNLKIFFFGTKRPMTLKFGMQHRVLKYYQVVHMVTLS